MNWTSNDIQQAPSLKINQSDTDLVTGKEYDNLPLTFFAKCAEDHGRSEVSSMSIAKRQISKPPTLCSAFTAYSLPVPRRLHKKTRPETVEIRKVCKKNAHDSVISHDAHFDAHFDARVKQIIQRYVEHCLILGPWIKGCVKSGAQPWEPPPSSSPNSKWSSSRPNLQRQKWATCGSSRETRLCSIFDSTAKNLEGSILTWLNDWANMAKSASLAQVTVVFHGCQCLDVTCHIESRHRKQMEACWVWPIGSHLVPTGGNALLGGTIVQLPSAHNPEAGICLVALQFVRVCWRILC